MALLTRRDPKTTRSSRVSLRVVAPMVAFAAIGITACSPPNQVASDVPGTTPAVWTGMPAPAGAPGSGEHGAEASDRVNTVLQGADGKAAGTATFVGNGTNVIVTVSAHGLTPGFHGLHVHSVGQCEGDFTSAGGHLQISGHTGTPESGDLPTLLVRQDGSADLTVTTDAFTVEDLRNHGQGTAIVVHAGTEANAPRVACGVIK